jgi:hypothetical protein
MNSNFNHFLFLYYKLFTFVKGKGTFQLDSTFARCLLTENEKPAFFFKSFDFCFVFLVDIPT